jgi:two-component system, NtrC family, nitrogen regulation sensor histidine kinase GlnL
MPRESANAFRGLDLLSSAVVVLDADFAIRYANPAAENLLATSTRAVVGRPLSSVFRYTALLQQALDNARNNNWSYTGQNIELSKGDKQSLHLHCTVTPVDVEGARLLLELRPIDQQIKASREERLLEQQQANRELIRNLAHEIKNPLGGIRGAAQLLDRELADPELREYTQVIIDETDRLQDLMQRLLTPHRVTKPSPINIHDVLERVRTLLLSEYPRGLEIRRDYDTSLPDVVGDREQLIQAVLNIARNAAQAIGAQSLEPSGQITLRTRALRQVTLVKRRYRLALELSVIDDGPGIPEDIRERMFYPLVSGREGGSGLGLTIAQNFVDQHHGTIECETRPGRTAFVIRLPLEG